ncbi:hypothetical protein Tco_0072231 [Tanacetum coccineum]
MRLLLLSQHLSNKLLQYLQRKKHKKKVSSVKLGRNKDEGTLSEEHYVQEDYTADHFFEDIVDKDAAVTPDLERKSDETEEINVEEKEASNVKSGDTEELDLETFQSTARQSTITPRTLNFDDEAGPSSPIRPTQEEGSEEQFKVDEVLADISLNISRPRGLSIPGPIQSQPQQPTQATDPKDKGKGILVEEPKKKKLTLQQIRALETTNDEEVARKIQAEWDAEEERKRLEELKKAKSKTILKKPTSLAQERNQMMNFLKGQGYKNLQKLRYPQMKELYDKVQESIKDSFKDFIPMGSEKEKQLFQERDTKRLLRKRKATISEEKPSKKLKLRTETIDALRNYLKIVDFEQNAQDRESKEGISVITEFKVIDSPDGEELYDMGLDHGMEVEDETETAITLIHLFILWTTEDGLSVIISSTLLLKYCSSVKNKQYLDEADVHPDELCPPNKRYDLMDANKKVELEHVQCPSESKILMNIIKNHPLRFSIAASASVISVQIYQKSQEEKSYTYSGRFHNNLSSSTTNDKIMPFGTPSFTIWFHITNTCFGFTMELIEIDTNFKILKNTRTRLDAGYQEHGIITEMRLKLTQPYKKNFRGEGSGESSSSMSEDRKYRGYLDGDRGVSSDDRIRKR